MIITTEWLDGLDLKDSAVLAESAARLLDQKKAKDVTLIDISGKTVIADYFVIAGATSTTAVRALVDFVCEELEKRGVTVSHRDIDPKWAAIDLGGVIMHVFYDELREFYSIERLWSDGGNVRKFKDID